MPDALPVETSPPPEPAPVAPAAPPVIAVQSPASSIALAPASPAPIGGAAVKGELGAGVAAPSAGDGDALHVPVLRYGPKPRYPVAAQRLGLEGRVMVAVLVEPSGRPGKAQVEKSSGVSMLDDAALDTIRDEYRFEPARRGSVAIPYWVKVPVRFTLRPDE